MKVARLIVTATIAACALAPLAALAQGYPNKPIKVIVPFGPGSGSDLLARVVSERMSEQMKVPVVVENREGAGGIIGTQLLAKSPADGYTIALVSNPVTIAPLLQPTPPFDPVKDFAPIIKLAIIPLAIITSSSSPYNTVPEMVAYLKAHPDKANYASSGKGAQSHLEAAQLMHSYDVAIQHVPYKSTSQALADTMTGNVNFYVPGLGPAIPNIKAGKLKVLAVGGSKRHPAIPDVPTIAEVTGKSPYDMSAWFGLLAPAGTSPEIVNRLYAEAAKAMDSPQVREKLPGLGAEALAVPPQEFANQIRAEHDQWAKLIKTLDIKGD